MEFKCNCNKEWSEKCKKRVTEELSQWDKLEMYPAQHHQYYEEYRDEGIISDAKNDVKLYNYLKNNNLLGEKLCYLEIANKLVLEDYKDRINKVNDNVDSMLDYLYWSYGEPNDLDNILRRYFVKKAMASSYDCDCKEQWGSQCKKYTERGLTYMADDLHMVPALYMIYFNEYGKMGIISKRKNDGFLYEYICKNNYLEDELCYYTLACKLCIKDSDDLLIKPESNIKFLVDYFVWSYGFPYAEDNILRRVLENNDVDLANHKYQPKEKKESNNTIVKNGYVRDARVRELALQLANFQCQIDKEHDTFISKKTLRNFVESHHLIPMEYYDEFQYNIDNEANIVALCPNCHSCLHLGRFEDKRVLLEKLYYKHIESLKKAGLEISLERLLEMYEDKNHLNILIENKGIYAEL